MANTKSALKMIRVAERRRARNAPVRSRVKTFIKKARLDIDSGQIEQAQEDVRKAVSALDKAAQKGVIHKNNAARRKSRLMKKLVKALATS